MEGQLGELVPESLSGSRLVPLVETVHTGDGSKVGYGLKVPNKNVVAHEPLRAED
jgi:hypothetical protein